MAKQAKAKKAKKVEDVPAGDVEIVLLNSNRMIIGVTTIPAEQAQQRTILVEGVTFEHVDEDKRGRWRYAAAR